MPMGIQSVSNANDLYSNEKHCTSCNHDMPAQRLQALTELMTTSVITSGVVALQTHRLVAFLAPGAYSMQIPEGAPLDGDAAPPASPIASLAAAEAALAAGDLASAAAAVERGMQGTAAAALAARWATAARCRAAAEQAAQLLQTHASAQAAGAAEVAS